jgi:hypothetical protein
VVSLLRLLPFLGMALLVMAPRATDAADPVMVKLQSQNNSGESGTATLTDEGGRQRSW